MYPPSAGRTLPPLYGRQYPPTPASPTSLFGNPATFTAAANTQASDYDRIMQGYSDLAKSYSTNPIAPGVARAQDVSFSSNVSPTPISYAPIQAQTAAYKQSADVTGSLADLSNLASTGGYSAADIADIRERDISPIRSIYANAQQNAERAKALSGGYSPNFNATQAQLARDEANQIGGATNAANAGIAQNVAANKIAVSPAYASAAAAANAAEIQANQKNADIINQINEFNAQNALQSGEFNSQLGLGAEEFNTSTNAAIAEANANRAASTDQFNINAALDAAKFNRGGTANALAGQASLYGTTPALTSLFGNQVMAATGANQNQQQINDRRNLGYFGNIGIGSNSPSWRF